MNQSHYNAVREAVNKDYSIDRQGNVYSCRRFGSKGGIIKQWLDGKGYYCVRLTIGERVRNYKVHRLLAQAFLPNPKGLSQINHIDGNPLNNSLENLEWCSPSHNLRHAYEHGLKKAKSTTGEKYIYRDKVNNKWRVIITNQDGTKNRLGRYATLKEAKKARDNALKASRSK